MLSSVYFWLISLLVAIVTFVTVYTVSLPKTQLKVPSTPTKVSATSKTTSTTILSEPKSILQLQVEAENKAVSVVTAVPPSRQAKVQVVEEDIYSAFEAGSFVPEQPPEEIKTTVLGTIQSLSTYNFEIGSTIGLNSAATAINIELRFPLSYVLGPATTSLRMSCGYAQSEDTRRRYAPIQLDAIFNFPPGYLTGLENYLGAGLNYVVRTSGPATGTIGGQVFYGVQSSGFVGKIFTEMGYGILRTGFSPSHRGITLMVGYRQKFII